MAEGEEVERKQQWYESAWARLRELLDLWEKVIDAKGALSKLAGTASIVVFLAHPATPIAALISLALSAVLAAATVVALLWTLIASLL
jgi:hypothetical protein